MKTKLLSAAFAGLMLTACFDQSASQPTAEEIAARCSDPELLQDFVEQVLDKESKEPILRFNRSSNQSAQHSECVHTMVGTFETRRSTQYFVITFEVNPNDWSSEVYYLNGFVEQMDVAIFLNNSRYLPLWHPDYFHLR